MSAASATSTHARPLELFYGPGVRFGFHRRQPANAAVAVVSHAYVALVASPEQELLFQFAAEGAQQQVASMDLECPPREQEDVNADLLGLPPDDTGAMCTLQRFALEDASNSDGNALDSSSSSSSSSHSSRSSHSNSFSIQHWLASHFIMFPLSWPQRSVKTLLRVLGLVAADRALSSGATSVLDALDSSAASQDVFGARGSQTEISVDDLKSLLAVAEKHAQAYRFAVGLSVLQDQLAARPPVPVPVAGVGGVVVVAADDDTGSRGEHRHHHHHHHVDRVNSEVEYAAVEPKCAVRRLRDQVRTKIAPGLRHLLFVHYPKTAGTTLRIALKMFAEAHQVPFHSCYRCVSFVCDVHQLPHT